MAETTDGAMHFEASLDNRKLLGAIDETIRRINGLSDATVKGGAAMDASFSQMAAEIKQRFNKVDNTITSTCIILGSSERNTRLSDAPTSLPPRVSSGAAGLRSVR